MGEAKRRGNLQKRIEEGVVKAQLRQEAQAELVKQRRREEAIKLAAMSPEQRRRRRDAVMLLGQLAAWSAGSLLK